MTDIPVVIPTPTKPNTAGEKPIIIPTQPPNKPTPPADEPPQEVPEDDPSEAVAYINTMAQVPYLVTLAEQLEAAGIDTSRGIGCFFVGTDDEQKVYVHTYNASGAITDLPSNAQAVLDAYVEPEPETPPTEILLSLLADVTDVDETKPILEAMLMILGGNL